MRLEVLVALRDEALERMAGAGPVRRGGGSKARELDNGEDVG
jgi:hypothetical protein